MIKLKGFLIKIWFRNICLLLVNFLIYVFVYVKLLNKNCGKKLNFI